MNCWESVILIYLCCIPSTLVIMKAPLFLFISLFLICVFSGCRKSSYSYNSELPCGKINGDVKKVVDTTYTVVNGEIAHPLRTSEYCFDSCHRLTEEQYCVYYTANDDEGVNVSICYRELIKNRYDLDGRKVESHKKCSVYENDSVSNTAVSMLLAKWEGDSEIWDVSSTDESGEVLNQQIHRQYEKNKILTKFADDVSQAEMNTTQFFDESGNLVETCVSDGNGMEIHTVYKYNKENQLVEIIKCQANSDQIHKTVYQMDEYDNEGNWMKRTELNENNEIKTITRRRIEYRMSINSK